jgi:hypothetical protein
MKKKKHLNIYHLGIILVWPIIAGILSLIIKANNPTSIFLFLIIPSVYLSIIGRKYVLRAGIFTLIAGTFVIILLDYIAQITGAWVMYPNSIFPFKLFGLVTVEVILWALFTCYLIVMFYENFIHDHYNRKVIRPRMKYMFLISLVAFSIFLVFLFNFPSFLMIPYFYAIWGIIILLIPFVLHLFRYPQITSRFFLAAAFFFYMNFIYEIVALKLGWWSFPGEQFLGWISAFGVRFPLEELIFWFILLALTTLSYYEFYNCSEESGKVV